MAALFTEQRFGTVAVFGTQSTYGGAFNLLNVGGIGAIEQFGTAAFERIAQGFNPVDVTQVGSIAPMEVFGAAQVVRFTGPGVVAVFAEGVPSGETFGIGVFTAQLPFRASAPPNGSVTMDWVRGTARH